MSLRIQIDPLFPWRVGPVTVMDFLASHRKGSRFDPVLTNPVWESTGNLPVRFVKEIAIMVVTEERALFLFFGIKLSQGLQSHY